MKRNLLFSFLLFIGLLNFNCSNTDTSIGTKSSAELLGTTNYQAISYGGYRQISRDNVPSVEDIKEDLAILAALDIKLLRTYNTQQFAHAANLLKAIKELKQERNDFEMYVMLGAWIDCKGAWTDSPNHEEESLENNTAEIEAAIKLANTYPDIVKIIAVGNEAMVKWAASYYVQPKTILKWVNYLQEQKKGGQIPPDTWITSSDNFASWGGGDELYHVEDLEKLIKAVDFISLHTYPFHDTHYNNEFWGVPEKEEQLSKKEQIKAAMIRARDYAILQYETTANYVKSLGIEKTIHIGETGWSTTSNSFYGKDGSHAADEYKEKLYHDHMRAWTTEKGIRCFYFEAFDEQWKDAGNPQGSENHFGLINLKGEAKYTLWDKVDAGVFKGLKRGDKSISKTFNGNEQALMNAILAPPFSRAPSDYDIKTINEDRAIGDAVSEDQYVILHDQITPDEKNQATYPSAGLKLNAWEGTCTIKMQSDNSIEVITGTGDWWGAALELQAEGKGENLAAFENGTLHFELKGDTKSSVEIGFQTGVYNKGTQTNNFVVFGPNQKNAISNDWQSFSIKMTDLNKGANLKDVTSVLFFRGADQFDGKSIFVRNVYYSKE